MPSFLPIHCGVTPRPLPRLGLHTGVSAVLELITPGICRCGRRFVSWRDERRERLRSETWDDDDDGNDRRRKAKKARRRRKKRSPTLTDSEPRRARIPRR